MSAELEGLVGSALDSAFAINDRGDIVGISGDRAVIWD